ncbi:MULTISPECIES: hypothetical protein [unclassified Brevundimonas]|jgi:hypothetical protein|uniref:hypothetical protein n=1 Tax=unclassified Brevundimonas TaxID=2622653 RepID=UPI000C5D345D|nr:MULTISPECIES: hypothetical protein [unclassified Brevundimonas]MAL88798.1 hypothetical protein [Brevundimonas sp.]HAJ02304.1 hypothetical protein [Brevundimonas sp.]HAV50469.1 hypothetical protein [Brevundimonas sp.]|tara:strand:- start:221 stop:439 length:219 start_codon:yes stop_codon:yes gene_type:complete
MTTDDEDLTRAAAYVEMAMRPYLMSGGPVPDLALAMIAGAVGLLVPSWGAERVLAATDKLVEHAASEMGSRH